jgi:AcrR family transcriptional regulator
MTDVAERLELSHALLYRYVESKEALLELATLHAMGEADDLTVDVPLATPPKGRILHLLQGWLVVQATFPELRAALERDPSGEAPAELSGIIDELYDFVEQNRLLLLLVESLVNDYPGISWESVNDHKRFHISLLATYLGSRAASGGLRLVADAEIAAHFVSETVAWFAQHRKRDPNTALIDDQLARSSVRRLLLAAFVPDARSAAPRQ